MEEKSQCKRGAIRAHCAERVVAGSSRARHTSTAHLVEIAPFRQSSVQSTECQQRQQEQHDASARSHVGGSRKYLGGLLFKSGRGLRQLIKSGEPPRLRLAPCRAALFESHLNIEFSALSTLHRPQSLAHAHCCTGTFIVNSPDLPNDEVGHCALYFRICSQIYTSFIRVLSIIQQSPESPSK